jgi:hypothetical protein
VTQDFQINEYVWDRVREGSAIVIGFSEETGRYTVAEIVLPARKLGRVALRQAEELCRYVRLIVPEDEAEALDAVLGGTVSEAHPNVLGDSLARFIKRLRDGRRDRGLLRGK